MLQENIINNFKIKNGINNFQPVSFYKIIAKKLENKTRSKFRSVVMRKSQFGKLNNNDGFNLIVLNDIFEDVNEKIIQEEKDRIEDEREWIREMAREERRIMKLERYLDKQR